MVMFCSDPEPTYTGVIPSLGSPQIRIRNLDIILKNIQYLYQEEFGQTIIMIPDIVRLGLEPKTPAGHQDMALLLLLLLSCAVQCPNKKIFIDKIKLLDVEVQHSIVECIKKVCQINGFIVYLSNIKMSKEQFYISLIHDIFHNI